MKPRRCPWRALAFLLLALVLVQAYAYPPEEALRRFGQERVLPLARELRLETYAWMATLEGILGKRRVRATRVAQESG